MSEQRTLTLALHNVLAGNTVTAFSKWDDDFDTRRFEWAPIISGFSSMGGEQWVEMRREAVDWHDEPLACAFSAIPLCSGVVIATFSLITPGRRWMRAERPWKACMVETGMNPFGRIVEIRSEEAFER